MKEKIRIKTEFQAKRCEVCHQRDCFDSQTNNCSRCGFVAIEKRDVKEFVNAQGPKNTVIKETRRTGISRILMAVVLAPFVVAPKTFYEVTSGRELIFPIFVIWFLVEGLTDFITWYYLKNGRMSPVKKYQKLIFNTVSFLIILGCITQQVLNGTISLYLSLLGGAFLVISLLGYYLDQYKTKT